MVKWRNQKIEPIGICPSSETDLLTHIEKCGRHCYLSHDKMNETSHLKFFEMLCKNGHLSVFGHSNIVFNISNISPALFEAVRRMLNTNARDVYKFIFTNFIASFGQLASYFRFVINDVNIIVSGNIRAWVEYLNRASNRCFCYVDLCEAFAKYYPFVWENINKYLRNENFLSNYIETIPTLIPNFDKSGIASITPVDEETQAHRYSDYDIPQYTFFVVTNRGISHEIVRHTTFTFSQESTRYVNYRNRGVEFIEDDVISENEEVEKLLENTVEVYDCIKSAPQWARNILPHALKTQLTMTGRKSAYDHFIKVRSSSGAHPQVRELAFELKKFFDKGVI